MNILVLKYGKSFLFILICLFLTSFIFSFVSIKRFYNLRKKHILLKKRGIVTIAHILKKELTGFRGGYALIYYEFLDQKQKLIRQKEEVGRKLFNNINPGDKIKIKYLPENPSISLIVNNKSPLIARGIYMSIFIFLFLINLAVIFHITNDVKKINFLYKNGIKTKGIILKKTGSTVYYEFTDEKGITYKFKEWFPSSKFLSKFDKTVIVVYDRNNPKKNAIYVKDFNQ